MSKKSSKSQESAPKPPEPQSERFYQDGVLQSDRIYDKSFGGYNTNVYNTPEEQAIEKQATGLISNLIPQASQAFNLSPEAIQDYTEAYAAPQRRALTDSYNTAMGQAVNAAGSAGLGKSVGFEKYKANELEKNKAQGMADIEANAKMMSYDLPRRILAPFGDAFNLYNAALSGQQAQSMTGLEPAFQGSQSSSNFAAGNYANQLNYYNMNNQQKQNQGLLGRIFAF